MPILESFLHNPLDPVFWSALASIIVIDLALAGDNAIVIAMAARALPKQLQFRAIFWGTFGAIVVRIAMTIGVMWLLKIPALMLVGAALLVPIALRLLQPSHAVARTDVHAAPGFWSALGTIVAADALMGLDNVLGIAGAANGHIGLVVIGLLVSVPLVVWGSTLLLKWLERWPAIVYVGAAAIAWTAARMLTHDLLVQAWFDAHDNLRYAVDAVVVIGVLALGAWLRRRQRVAGVA